MASYYETEQENQRKSGAFADTILPVLAALEAVGTSIATNGRNPSSNALGIYKDVQAGRMGALDRALKRDEGKRMDDLRTAESARAAKRLGLEEATFQADENKAHRALIDREKAITRMLGTPDVTDEKTNTVTMGRKGLPDLTELDKVAIETDPMGWLSNKLKPQSMTFLPGLDAIYQIPKAGGVAAPVKTEGGGTVKPPPRPTGNTKTPEQIAAEAKARALGAAEAEKEVAGQTSIPGLSAIPGATITNDGIKKVQDIAIRKDELVKSISRLQELYKKYGTEIYGDAAREMESLVKGIQLTAKEFYNLGVLNGPDLGLMESMIANPTSLRSKAISMVPGAGDPVTPKLNEAKSLINNRFRSTINRYGFQEAGGGSGQVPEGTEKINAQGVKMRMTGGKWRVAQ